MTSAAKDNFRIKLLLLKLKEQSKFIPEKNLITKEKQRYHMEYDTFYILFSFVRSFVHRCKFLDWLHTVHNKFIMWFYYGKQTDENSNKKNLVQKQMLSLRRRMPKWKYSSIKKFRCLVLAIRVECILLNVVYCVCVVWCCIYDFIILS